MHCIGMSLLMFKTVFVDVSEVLAADSPKRGDVTFMLFSGPNAQHDSITGT